MQFHGFFGGKQPENSLIGDKREIGMMQNLPTMASHWPIGMSLKPVCGTITKNMRKYAVITTYTMLYYWYRCCRRYYMGNISGTYLIHRGWIIVAMIFTILLLFTSRVWVSSSNAHGGCKRLKTGQNNYKHCYLLLTTKKKKLRERAHTVHGNNR